MMVIEGVGDTGNRPAAVAQQTDSEQKRVTSNSTTATATSRPDIEISATALYLSSTEQAAIGQVIHSAASADSTQSLTAIGETASEPETIAHKLVQLEQLFFNRS
ncbi:hypothetical protein [Kistimonas scapharcae]